MNSIDLITRELADLPEAQRAKVLDFIGYLKPRHPTDRTTTSRQERLAELTAFFTPYRKDLSGFVFDRHDANAR